MSGKNRKQDILAWCLEEIRSGRISAHDCLKNYPELEKELLPLVEIGSSIRSSEVHASNGFKARAKQLLYREMNATGKQTKEGRFPARMRLFPAFRGAALIVLLAVVFGLFGGAIYASQGSLPDEPLYQVKSSWENLHLATTFNPSNKAYVLLSLSEKRLNEVTEQARLERPISGKALAAVTENIDKAIISVGEDPDNDDREFLNRLSETSAKEESEVMLIGPQLSRNDQSALNNTAQAIKRVKIIVRVAAGNPDFLLSCPSIMDTSLESRMFKISGHLVKIDKETWVTGGVVIEKVRVAPAMDIAEGDVEIEGLSDDDGTFISKTRAVSELQDQIKIRGTFSGTNEDGSEWYFGEIGVPVPKNLKDPAIGTKVSLEEIHRASGESAAWSEDTEWYYEGSEESGGKGSDLYEGRTEIGQTSETDEKNPQPTESAPQQDEIAPRTDENRLNDEINSETNETRLSPTAAESGANQERSDAGEVTSAGGETDIDTTAEMTDVDETRPDTDEAKPDDNGSGLASFPEQATSYAEDENENSPENNDSRRTPENHGNGSETEND